MWRCSSRRGVVDEPTSPSHDRGQANPQPDSEYATCVCRTGCPVRQPFRSPSQNGGKGAAGGDLRRRVQPVRPLGQRIWQCRCPRFVMGSMMRLTTYLPRYCGLAPSIRFNSCSASFGRSSSAAARFSCKCVRDEVPGISSMLGARRSSQASATCMGVAPRR